MSEKELFYLISSNIVRFLAKNNKTQAQLAEYVGVSTATASNWCKGIKMPRMDKFDKICEFLNCDRSDLMETEEVARRAHASRIAGSSDAIADLVTIAAGMNDDMLNQLITYARFLLH